MGKLELRGKLTRLDFLKLYKKCKDVRLKEHYHAMYLSFSYDWEEVAVILGRDYQTILEWAKAYNESGLEGLESDKPSGRPPRLTPEQQNEVKRTVQMSPRKLGFKFGNWNCKNLSWWILKKFRIKLKREAIRLLLHKLGFVLIKPTYKYVLADKHERKRFLRRFRRKCKSLSCRDLLMFLDEASVKQHPTLMAKWMLQGSKEYVKTFGNHAKTNIFGAITALGDVFHMKSAKQNSGVFIKFLEHLMTLNPKKRLVLVIDNAPWHKSKKVQKFLEKVQDKIQVLLLPAYSPDLNPIEHLWRFMKSVVANVFFVKMNDLNNALTDFFKNLYSKSEKILSLCSHDYLLG